MLFSVTTTEHGDGTKRVYFNGVEAWDDFDLILNILSKEKGFNVLSNSEMLYIREAVLERKGMELHLKHDDILGSFLYTRQSEEVPLLEQLAHSVIDSIVRKIEEKGRL